MRDCYYGRDTGKGDFEEGIREIIILKNREPGFPIDENLLRN